MPNSVIHKHAESFEKAAKILKAADRIVVVMHQRPDGDAMGSALALSHYLEHLQKDHDIFCLHAAPAQFAFLPKVELVQNDESIITHGGHDVVVCLDSGDLAYAGIEDLLNKKTNDHTLINFDHHATNTQYGHVNVVDPKASSTSELLYHFLEHMKHTISRDAATCMLTGIMTDTNGFSNLATSSASLSVASKLLEKGARIWDIQEHTQKNKPVQTLKLWGIALSRLTTTTSGLVVTFLTLHDLQSCNADADSADGIANFLNSVDKAKAIMVIREEEGGLLKINLRTTQQGVDVSRFAKYFGGGGHKKAAGFSIPGHIVKTDKGWTVE